MRSKNYKSKVTTPANNFDTYKLSEFSFTFPPFHTIYRACPEVSFRSVDSQNGKLSLRWPLATQQG